MSRDWVLYASRLAHAEHFLENYLADGEDHRVGDIMRAARALGFYDRIIYRARDSCNYLHEHDCRRLRESRWDCRGFIEEVRVSHRRRYWYRTDKRYARDFLGLTPEQVRTFRLNGGYPSW